MQKLRKGNLLRVLGIFLVLLTSLTTYAEKPTAKKIMFFGDSTTGWLAERLQAYGEKNGFEVATVVWDGATMNKYAKNATKLKQYITAAKPDAVFVSLGMNDMGVTNPEARLNDSLQKIKGAIGNIPIIWVGPASWPAHPTWGPSLDKWMPTKLGAGHYYSSLSLSLPRQSKTNPHPTRIGANKWIDSVVKWIKDGHAAINLPGYNMPDKATARPKSYTYKRMREAL